MIRLCVLLVFFTTCIHAQVTEQDVSRLSFINREKNIIHNDSALFPFYEKLKSLEQDKSDKIIVSHIGDSHIQADFFSGRIREALQKKFGNAGRGLVFPYRAARSNEPYSIRSSGKGKWRSGRNVSNRDSLPIGVTGFSLETNDTSGIIFLKIASSDSLDYSFKVVEVYCENDSGFCRPLLKDTASVQALQSVSSELQKETFVFSSRTSSLELMPSAKDTVNPMRLYGLNLMNDEGGLLYHSIGVNGAEFRHYLGSKYFFAQFFRLKPELVIVSLGTNEAYGKAFAADQFVNSMKAFADTIRKALPETIILFTVPSDSYRGRYRNRTVELARTLMINFCNVNGYPYWDLFEVMGGAGSMAKWYANGLTAKDRLHFRPKGYAIQGFLFNEAFLNSYHAFSGDKQQ